MRQVCYAEILSGLATGDATIGAAPDAFPVNFVSYGGTFPGSAFLSSVTGTSGATLTFGASLPYDYSPPPADRLVLEVTNNASVALTSITFAAPVYNYGGYNVNPGIYVAGVFTNSGIVVGTSSGFTYDFGTPLAVGDSIAFYIPLSAPDSSSSYGYSIGESVTTVPEPSTFALLGLSGIGLAVGSYRRGKWGHSIC